MNYWQIMSGSYGRDYSGDFIDFGMAFVGGDWQIDAIQQVKIDDRIILKRGNSAIVAVGVVIERNGKCCGKYDKLWLTDYDGWELEGYCYVDWHIPENPVATSGLTRSTICNTNIQSIKDTADDIIKTYPSRNNYKQEPSDPIRLDDNSLLRSLIDDGFRISQAQAFIEALTKIRLLANYYLSSEQVGWILEHETRTFLVIPFLVSLGWSEQHIKIEYNNIDIACFGKPFKPIPERNDFVKLLFETKNLSTGLDYAPAQALDYAKNYKNCNVFVVTNGIGYKIFKKQEDGSFPIKPTAYLNIRHLWEKHPVYPDKIEGCCEAIRLMLPGA